MGNFPPQPQEGAAGSWAPGGALFETPVGKGPGEEDALGSTRAPFGAGLLWGVGQKTEKTGGEMG